MQQQYLVPAAALLSALIMSTAPSAAFAGPKKYVPPRDVIAGQGQRAGGNGAFGTVYSLKNGFNFEIISAKYTLDPYVAYTPLRARTGEKLLILSIAIKNATSTANFFNDESLFTLVDSNGRDYGGYDLELASAGVQNVNTTLQPGQGYGQRSTFDPLTEAFELPGDARIAKILVNATRRGTSDDVIRYYIAGATASEAGEAGDPRNIIAALPADVRDSSDLSGATVLARGIGTIGQYEPSGLYYLRLDSFAYSTDPIYNHSAPPSGKKYAVATVTAKSPTAEPDSMVSVDGGDNTLDMIETADGDRIKRDGVKKAAGDENAEHAFQLGDEYTFRLFFILDSDTDAKTLVLGAGGASTWAYDVSGLH